MSTGPDADTKYNWKTNVEGWCLFICHEHSIACAHRAINEKWQFQK